MRAWVLHEATINRGDVHVIRLTVDRGLVSRKLDQIELTYDEAIDLAHQCLSAAIIYRSVERRTTPGVKG